MMIRHNEYILILFCLSSTVVQARHLSSQDSISCNSYVKVTIVCVTHSYRFIQHAKYPVNNGKVA